MLTALSIRDIVLIDRLDLEFDAGLSVLSGETGAGKSILLDSLSLALGQRGDAGLVRQGAAQGSVTAVFHLSHADHIAHSIAAGHGFALEDEIVLRRVQYGDGRTRGFLNDEPVSAKLLKEIGDYLVEVHGQQDGRALHDVSTHLEMIDAFGGLSVAREKVSVEWNKARDAREALAAYRDDMATVARDAEFLKVSLAELDEAAPEIGEEQKLATTRQMMREGERIAEDLGEADAALSGNDSAAKGEATQNGADAQIAAALGALERAEARAPGSVSAILETLGRASVELEEARGALEDLIQRSDADPARLEEVEERLFGLRALGRKHSVEVDELAGFAETLRGRLAAIEGGEEELVRLTADADKAQANFVRLARSLGAERGKAAKQFVKKVMAELPSLKLENARFEAAHEELDEAAGGPTGLDRIEFQIAANPGTALGPLRKVASGGELARVMLALKVVLAGRDGGATLIFDEIDAGVGGAVAHAVGERLARLGEEVQVLVVTHSPQVAAKGRGHFLIEKSAGRGDDVMMSTTVTGLSPHARHEEVARMLAGAVITDEARAAAAKLIAGEV